MLSPKTSRSISSTSSMRRRRPPPQIDWAALGHSYGVEDFPLFDPNVELESPRTVSACTTEGVLPEELVYKPLEAFQGPDVSAQAAELRHDYMEARRQDLLCMIRATRAAEETQGEVELFGGVGSLDVPMPSSNTREFFKKWGEEFSLHNPVAAGSPEGASGSADGDQGPPKEGMPPSSPQSPSSPASPSSPSVGKKRREISEAALLDLLEGVRAAPRSDRIEHDSARKTEDLLVVKRLQDQQKMSYSHKDTKRLAGKRATCSRTRFGKLRQADAEIHELKHLRYAMLSPTSEASPQATLRGTWSATSSWSMSPLSTMGGGDLGGTLGSTLQRSSSGIKFEEARERVISRMQEKEEYWGSRLKERLATEHKREQRLFEDLASTKMKFAQLVMEDRIRWRGNHDEVLHQQEEYELEKARLFKKRQERMEDIAARTDTAAGLRQEVKNLREVHRLLNAGREERRNQFRKARRQQALQQFRNAATASASSPSGSAGSPGLPPLQRSRTLPALRE